MMVRERWDKKLNFYVSLKNYLFFGAFLDPEYFKIRSHLESLRNRYLSEVESEREEKLWKEREIQRYKTYYGEYYKRLRSRRLLEEYNLFYEKTGKFFVNQNRLNKFYVLSSKINYAKEFKLDPFSKYIRYDALNWEERSVGLKLRLFFINLTKAFMFVYKYNDYTGLKSFYRFYYTWFWVGVSEEKFNYKYKLYIYNYSKKISKIFSKLNKIKLIKFSFYYRILFSFKSKLIKIFWNIPFVAPKKTHILPIDMKYSRIFHIDRQNMRFFRRYKRNISKNFYKFTFKTKQNSIIKRKFY